MVTDKQAIEKAASYLKSLASELPGNLVERPDNIRLETIQHFGKDWVVVLSYFSKAKGGTDPDWVKFLKGVRRFKEFTIDGKTGTVTAMKDPSFAS